SLIRGVRDHAMGRFRSTLAPHGSPGDQLRNHLRAVRKLLLEEPELGAVMAELALRASRDADIGAIVDGTFDAWTTTTRGLLRRAVKAGAMRPELDSAPVAALIVATLSSLTLPPMADTRAGGAGGDRRPALGDRDVRRGELGPEPPGRGPGDPVGRAAPGRGAGDRAGRGDRDGVLSRRHRSLHPPHASRNRCRAGVAAGC